MQACLIASIGSRLVCLRPEGQQGPTQQRPSLSTCAWTRTRDALSAISVSPGSGLIAAVGPSQSAVIYRYSPDRGFELVCADPVSHNPVACLPLNRSAEDAVQVRACNSRISPASLQAIACLHYVVQTHKKQNSCPPSAVLEYSRALRRSSSF